MGRPTKLTPEIARGIVTAVRVGLPVVQAAQLMGVSKPTVLQWLQRGSGTHSRAKTTVYGDFVDQIEKAKAEDEARRLARIEQAGRGGAVLSEKTVTFPNGRTLVERHYTQPAWQADAWHLERTRPDQYGRRDRLAVQLQIEAVAARVAAELGLRAEDVLAEAQLLLKEMDHGELSGPQAG